MKDCEKGPREGEQLWSHANRFSFNEVSEVPDHFRNLTGLKMNMKAVSRYRKTSNEDSSRRKSESFPRYISYN